MYTNKKMKKKTEVKEKPIEMYFPKKIIWLNFSIGIQSNFIFHFNPIIIIFYLQNRYIKI